MWHLHFEINAFLCCDVTPCEKSLRIQNHVVRERKLICSVTCRRYLCVWFKQKLRYKLQWIVVKANSEMKLLQQSVCNVPIKDLVKTGIRTIRFFK